MRVRREEVMWWFMVCALQAGRAHHTQTKRVFLYFWDNQTFRLTSKIGRTKDDSSAPLNLKLGTHHHAFSSWTACETIYLRWCPEARAAVVGKVPCTDMNLGDSGPYTEVSEDFKRESVRSLGRRIESWYVGRILRLYTFSSDTNRSQIILAA